MAIFDIFDEVTEKNIVKSETGDPRIFGVLVGEVTSNYDMQMPGRVCVSIHVRDEQANILKWARVAMPSSGEEWGHYFLPEVGDQVLVVFDQGIIDRPYVIGCIPKDKNKFLKETKHQNNVYKKITTKHGSSIIFQDGLSAPVETPTASTGTTTPAKAPEEDGSNDSISIITANESHKVILDNAKHQIIIQDSDKNASIEMNTQKGSIDIKAFSTLNIKVGESITVALNGTTGKITINANDVSVDSVGQMVLKGGGRAELSGAMVSVSAQGKASVSATGPVSLSGKPIKIG